MTQPSPSAGLLSGRAHLLAVRVYYEDTDFSGLVYHANYLRFFERGRSDCLRMLGISHQALLAASPPTAFAVNRIGVDFVRAARIDDELVVATTFDAVKGPRLIISQTILRGAEEIARAAVEACCIGLDGRPRRPPEALLAALRPHLAP